MRIKPEVYDKAKPDLYHRARRLLNTKLAQDGMGDVTSQ